MPALADAADLGSVYYLFVPAVVVDYLFVLVESHPVESHLYCLCRLEFY